MACGAKVPPIPKTEKNKVKKKHFRWKAAAAIIAVFILALVSVWIFGDGFVPEKVRDTKAYSWAAGAVRGKLPEEINLPLGLKVEFPLDLPDFAFQLPFGLDERLSGLTKRISELPLLGFLSDDDSAKGKQAGEGQADGNESARSQGGGDGLDGGAAAESGQGAENKTAGESGEDKQGAESANASAGGEGGNHVNTVERSDEEKEFIAAGADNSVVLSDYNIYADIPTDWIRSNVKILEHRTDINAGTDTVTIYLELENSYVNMTGTKEITYAYNEETGNWEAGPASKISCLSVEPVTAEL
jgi:hypothetical protein